MDVATGQTEKPVTFVVEAITGFGSLDDLSTFALWSRIAMNRDVSTEQLVLPFAGSIAPHTHSLPSLWGKCMIRSLKSTWFGPIVSWSFTETDQLTSKSLLFLVPMVAWRSTAVVTAGYVYVMSISKIKSVFTSFMDLVVVKRQESRYRLVPRF